MAGPGWRSQLTSAFWLPGARGSLPPAVNLQDSWSAQIALGPGAGLGTSLFQLLFPQRTVSQGQPGKGIRKTLTQKLEGSSLSSSSELRRQRGSFVGMGSLLPEVRSWEDIP